MSAATSQPGASHAPQLLAELRHAHHIIKAMLNAMTLQQKARVHEQLDKAGVSGEGMTRANERLAVIEAAAAQASTAAPVSASTKGVSKQLRDIEAHAVDILSQADHAAILLRAVFDKLDEVGDAAPGVAAINCFVTCTARAVVLMRDAANNIVGSVTKGGAA